jgi:hypothetical protein
MRNRRTRIGLVAAAVGSVALAGFTMTDASAASRAPQIHAVGCADTLPNIPNQSYQGFASILEDIHLVNANHPTCTFQGEIVFYTISGRAPQGVFVPVLRDRGPH